MKKLLAVLIVLAFVAPVIPAMADDTLDVSGAARVRAFNKKNHDFDTDTSDDDKKYWDQRFRVQGTITPSDGVKGVFRIDMAENGWGSASMDDMSSNNDTGGVDVDRAYLAINKGIVSLSAGLQSAALGNAVAYDGVHTGVIASIATPVTITLVYFKVDEDQNDSDPANLTDEDTFEDRDHYAINLGYAADNFSVNVFYAMQEDGQAPQAAPYTADPDEISANELEIDANCIGVQGKFAVGPVNINAELDIFGGEVKTVGGDIDIVGTQFFADVSMAMSDALTLGAHLVYSQGTDDDNELKITYLTDDGSTVFSDYGAMNTLGISPLGPDDIFDADVVDNLTGAAGGDGLADGTGTMGAGLYVQFKAMEDLTLYGQILYATADEDLSSVTGEFDNLLLYTVSAKYTIVPNAHISVQYGYYDLELQDGVDTDAASTLGARLQIDF